MSSEGGIGEEVGEEQGVVGAEDAQYQLDLEARYDDEDDDYFQVRVSCMHMYDGATRTMAMRMMTTSRCVFLVCTCMMWPLALWQ